MSGDLPIGWIRTAIQDVVRRLEYGYTAKAERQGDGPKFLRITDIENGLIDWTAVPRCKIADGGFAKYRLEHGDIVFARTGSIEKACVIRNPPDSVFASYLIRGRPIETRTAAWLAAFVASFQYRNQAAAASAGIGRANINAKSLGRIELCLPPLAEQHRIVEAIDSYFTRLDDAVATLERVQRNLKRYRASVLRAAVEGRLVPTEAQLARAEGRSYEPASVLLERILAERRRRWEAAELAKMKAKGKAPKDDGWKARYEEPVPVESTDLPELAEGWCWVSMDHLLTAIEAGRSFRCVERPPDSRQVGVVKVSSVTWGRFNEDESKTCIRRELVNPDYFIRSGDFIISRANTIELVGAAVIVGALTKTLMLSDKILRLRVAGGLERWLLWVLRSSHGRDEIERLATGNQDSMRNIGQTNIRQIRIPLPPQSEVERIVEAVDERSSIAQHGESVLSAAEARCSRLRQSILKWAFEGKLVDQDPTDEPASVLLERIRAERESAGGTAPKARGRRNRRASKA